MSILRAIRSAAIVVDRDFNVLEDNGFAASTPEEIRTFGMSAGPHRQLFFKNPHHQEKIRNIFGGLVAEEATGADFVILPGRGGKFRIVLHIVPLRDYVSHEAFAGARHDWAFLLWWRRASAVRQSNFASMNREFGLTRAEMLIVEAIGQGRTLEEFAEQRGISPVTARNQLRNASAKLGLTRQAEIAALYAELSMLWPLARVATSG